ncbi:large-conductance mechanosensitive channel [Dissophora ornata]|nr:hypothetical protein BGZ58_009331 [Dissophora ornata]KAI8595988.1 large-conductance mechanosensitive channel [Dissophora ornata]
MSSAIRNYNNNGRDTRRDRILHEIHDVEYSTRESLLHGGQVASSRAKTLCDHFKDFIDNGNVIGLAVGLILGASFTSLVNSLVEDIISPPLGIVLGQASLDDLFVVIKDGKNSSETYLTLEHAHADGAVCIAYGRFVQMNFNFIIVALALFLLIRLFQAFQQDEIIKSKVNCKYCRKKIRKTATRCEFCTSWQDATEPHQHIMSPPLTDADGHRSS